MYREADLANLAVSVNSLISTDVAKCSHISFEAYSDPGLTLLYSPGPGMVTLDFKTNPMLTEFSSIMTQNAQKTVVYLNAFTSGNIVSDNTQ